jgi:cytochrome c biogenesis protein CcmG, thiol:disulfide interchange protein DsbE
VQITPSFARIPIRRPTQIARFRFADTRIIGRLDKGLKRKLNTAVVLAFIAGLLFLFARPDYRQGEPSLRGRPARDFAYTLEGKPAHLSDLRGKVVLLNFWATWCPPCVDETQSLNQLQHRIAPLGGTVLGVSVDEDPNAYANFLKMYNITFPTYRDPSRQIPLSYGTTMYPDTYVITRSGRLDRKIVGAQDWTGPDLTAYINSLLNEK